MHQLALKRLVSDDRPTIGILTYRRAPLCFTLEDRHRAPGVKVAGDTRIPEGVYPLRWRQAGEYAAKYKRLGYPGSLEICDVPDYSAILIHPGNTHDDTAGCVLPGVTASWAARTVGTSREATKRVYELVMGKAEKWEIAILSL